MVVALPSWKSNLIAFTRINNVTLRSQNCSQDQVNDIAVEWRFLPRSHVGNVLCLRIKLCNNIIQGQNFFIKIFEIDDFCFENFLKETKLACFCYFFCKFF